MYSVVLDSDIVQYIHTNTPTSIPFHLTESLADISLNARNILDALAPHLEQSRSQVEITAVYSFRFRTYAKIGKRNPLNHTLAQSQKIKSFMFYKSQSYISISRPPYNNYIATIYFINPIPTSLPKCRTTTCSDLHFRTKRHGAMYIQGFSKQLRRFASAISRCIYIHINISDWATRTVAEQKAARSTTMRKLLSILSV